MAGWSGMYSPLLVWEKEWRETKASEPDVTETLRSVLGSRGWGNKLSAFTTEKLCFFPSSTVFVFSNTQDFVVIGFALQTEGGAFQQLRVWNTPLLMSFPLSMAKHWCCQETVREQDCLNGEFSFKKEKDLIKTWTTTLFRQFLNLFGKLAFIPLSLRRTHYSCALKLDQRNWSKKQGRGK